MEMIYDGALVMPSGCAMIDEEEMTYLLGGGSNLPYSRLMLSKASCLVFGVDLHKKYSKVSAVDIAAEIFTHAYIHYNYSGFLKLASKAGMKKAGEVLASTDDGIYIDNSLDKKKIYGIERYQIYRAVYAVG
jgi:hypothetical protein